jgi:glycosyltransferase involved in cell wall biosynthesis
MQMPMRCSVIICTRNRQGDLEHCLESISRQTLRPDEVIIVDGSDTDRLLTILNDQRFNKLALIYKHTDPGLTRQRNVGIKMTSGDILFFFDDDVELRNDYIEKIVEVYKKDRLGNVGGRE